MRSTRDALGTGLLGSPESFLVYTNPDALVFLCSACTKP